MKVIFIIPSYNDWDSLKVLSKQIKEVSDKEKWKDAELVIVNDASTEELDNSPKPFALKTTIVNLNSNQGNQKAIAIGLSYVNEQIHDYDYIIVMDADGEDKPSDVIKLINQAKKNESKKVVFAIRAKRNEGPIYIFFYTIYKILFKLLTGEKINLGHFSCVPKKILKKVLGVQGIWTHFVAAIIKSKLSFDTVTCDKGPRISGLTNQNNNMLVFHGLASMAVYMEIIVLRFLLISLAGMFVIGAGIGLVFYLKLSGFIPTLNWATNVIVGLVIMFIILVLIFFLSLLTLLNKNLNPSPPSKSTYKNYILNEKKIV